MTNRVILTAPKKIWLQVSEDKNDRREPFPPIPDGELTWCHESVCACEVAYVRADLARAKGKPSKMAKP